MAQFTVFNIGKANRMIEELKADNEKLSNEISELKAAAGSNDSELSKQAEDLSNQLKAEKETSATLAAEIGKFKATIEGQAAEIKSLNDKLAAKDDEVKVKVAQQTLEVQAALGQQPQPVPVKEAAIPAKATSGMDRIMSSAAQDLAKAGYVTKR